MSCSCRIMTVEETLLERGHYSPMDDDRAIKYCPLHKAAPELLEACKLAFERLKPGPVKKDYAGHVAVAAMSKAIWKAEGEK